MAHDLGEHRSTTPATGGPSGVDAAPMSTAAYNTPQQMAVAAVASGTTKANLRPANAIVGGFLAGAYIAFGGLLAIVASAGLKPDTWGGLVTLVTGVAFSLGLVLTIDRRRRTAHRQHDAGADRGAAPPGQRGPARRSNWALLTIGNLVGSLFVAYVLADRTGVIGSRGVQGRHPGSVDFARLAALDDGQGGHRERPARCSCGRWAATGWCASASGWPWPPPTSPARSSPSSSRSPRSSRSASTTWWPTCSSCRWRCSCTCRASRFVHLASNLIFAFLGNMVGAALFVAGAYWYLYLRDQPAD